MSVSQPVNDNAKTKAAAACVICGRRQTEKYAPFCSKRCADVDLYRWLNGRYAIPGAEETDERESAGDRGPEDD
jgi:endogenous inhibitor of DNA gyrase (YacG/DUF329 family)